ncbi:MAG: hypothetical protein LBL82_08840 [Oscillospiraceae bacterium]|nr:hypothetical protein [Oscillospiraceae bacterium]
MKKFTAMLIAALMLVTLFACGGDATDDNPPAGNVKTEKGFCFVSGETEIYPNDEAAAVIEALGEPKSYFEDPACAFDGVDKVYTYGGFQLRTYTIGETDYVFRVDIIDDTVATPEGLEIGADPAKITELYGEVENDGVLYKYTKGDSTFSVVVKDGAVASISYVAVLPEA